MRMRANPGGDEVVGRDRLISRIWQTLERQSVVLVAEHLADLLRLLQRDHYALRDPSDGSYSFRFPLIRRWWKMNEVFE